MGAAQGGDQAVDVGGLAEGQAGQLKADGPALGPDHQLVGLMVAQRQPGELRDQRRGLGGREAQIGAAQLGQLAAGAQTAQGQLWILAAGQQQPQRRRRVGQEPAERLVDRRGVQGVVVLQHQNERCRHAR